MRSSRSNSEAFELSSNPTNFIRALWSYQAPLNGFAPTPKSGFDVLDISPDGLPWLYDNAAGIPATKAFRTAAGGFHFLFLGRPYLWCPTRELARRVKVVTAGDGATEAMPQGGTPYLDEPIADWPRWILTSLRGGLTRPPAYSPPGVSQGVRR